MLEVKLIDKGYEHIYNQLLKLKLPLNKKHRDFLDQRKQEIKKSYDKYFYSRNVGYYGFVQLWRGKLLYRIFAIRLKIDRRKKEKAQVSEMEVMRLLEGYYYGAVYSTNVWCGMGWKELCVFPDENEPCYWYYQRKWGHKWVYQSYRYLDYFVNNISTAEDTMILKPELVHSCITNEDNPVHYLSYYRQYPEIEFLRKNQLNGLIDSKLFHKRYVKGDKRFMKFLYRCHQSEIPILTYQEYNKAYKKYGLDINKFKMMLEAEKIKRYISGFSDKIYLKLVGYLHHQNESEIYYSDYINMVRKCGHDGDYWIFPKNLKKAHDSIMIEYYHVLELEEQSKIKEANEKLKLVVKYLKKNDCEIDGYQIFIPDTIDEIKRQAKELHQCLITASYDKKMIEQRSILVFIQKDKTPVATCEIDYKKKKKQFYANECDIDNCMPSKDIVSIFDKWLENAKIRKRKVNYA